jgi:hypothetical protein
MSNIRIGFSSGSSIISSIIKWFTRGKASHSYVVFYDETLGRNIVIESTWYGYRLSQYKKWIKENKVINEFKCKENLSDNLKFMASKLGQDYDYWSALGLAAKRWFGKLYRNPFRDPKKLHCSEAIVLFLQYSDFAMYLDPESSTPEDLRLYCLSDERFEKILECG